MAMSLPAAYNQLICEFERLLLQDLDENEKSVKVFKERTKNLRCSKKAESKDVKRNMEEYVDVLKTVQTKPTFTVGPPKVKKRQKQVILPGKLTTSQLTLDISSTVMAVNKMDFNASGGRAIPLCLPNDCEWNKRDNSCNKNKSIARESLIINPEAVKILEAITNPISVVSIVGPCRTGKSYILSRLISSQQYGDHRFKLGHQMDPETMGIWMWDTPLQYQQESGEPVTVILLDTEGIDAYNADKHGDTQIFTLSVLLSSLLIYNSTQVPRRDDLDQMTFIANLAKSVGSRGSKSLNKEEIKQIAPAFLWLLRDAILEPVNAQGQPCHFKDYLIEKVLARDTDDSFEESIRDKASKCLLEFFTSLDAEMIPPPSTSPHVMANIEDPRYKDDISSDFHQQVEYVRTKIFQKCLPKRGYTKGSLMNGIQFTGILQMYVDALNSPNGIPKVGSAWDQVMANTYQTAIKAALEMYDSRMSNLVLPMEENELIVQHRSAFEESIQKFKVLTELDSDGNAFEKHYGQLKTAIVEYSDDSSECIGGLLLKYSEQNMIASEKQCRQLLQKLRDAHLSLLISNLSPDTNYENIVDAVDKIETEYHEQSKGPAKGRMFDEFEMSLEDELKQFKEQLIKLKNYDDQLQIKDEELSKQRLLYEKEEKEKRNLEAKLHSNQMEVKALHDKMKATEKRLLEEATKKQDEHNKQMQAIQQARMDAQSRYEKIQGDFVDSQKRNSELHKRISDLQTTQANLQSQITSLQNKPPPAPVVIVKKKRRKKRRF